MKAYIVRHGDKASGDYYDPRLRHHDQPLSRLGRKQATLVKKYFHHKSFRAIYASEYVRTEQTTQPLAKVKGIEPVIDPRLNEIDIGAVDGLTDEQMQEAYPETWSAYQDRNRDFRWPGGETGSEAQGRIVDFLMQQAGAPGDILLVAHDGVIRCLALVIYFINLTFKVENSIYDLFVCLKREGSLY
jgi:broad specificity phosphatase PhoE